MRIELFVDARRARRARFNFGEVEAMFQSRKALDMAISMSKDPLLVPFTRYICACIWSSYFFLRLEIASFVAGLSEERSSEIDQLWR